MKINHLGELVKNPCSWGPIPQRFQFSGTGVRAKRKYACLASSQHESFKKEHTKQTNAYQMRLISSFFNGF